ncbi:MAG: class I mannose-6-phosphate isomerase [Planctomycetes bacterium]|nr:class I mannose-6-phosphate isomerase [Planctomycetota bacterium]
MNPPPLPLIFEPIFKSRPWGGRELQARLGKAIPADVPSGESWELVSLPSDESRVRGGPFSGKTLREITQLWGAKLIGGAATVNDRFPLLIKFLDAREDLSIQVHPRPAGDGSLAGDVKHEAWYIIAAAPGARILAGCREGATPADFERSKGTRKILDHLQSWPVRPGDCYYLPSGIPHAHGAGVLVAEIQTPSDVTYRLYDWERLGLNGRPRELHLAEGLANLRLDVPPDMIRQPRRHSAAGLSTSTHLCSCDRFVIDRLRMSEGLRRRMATFEPIIWIVLDGAGAFHRGAHETPFTKGDVVLVPADNGDIDVSLTRDADVLEVMIPTPSSLSGMPHPAREAAAGNSNLTQLTRPPAR